MFEKAKWITKRSLTLPWYDWNPPQRNTDIPSPYLAKSFSLGKPLKKAILNAVGYGQAVYFCNGARIPGSYLPTINTDSTKTVVYNTYDITALLRQGKNRFGMLLGSDHYPFDPLHPMYMRAIVQIDLTYTDGTSEQVVSDSTFGVAASPILSSNKYFGERYDARLEIEGWCDPDFDDSKWEKAMVCSPPGGKYREILSPPITVIREIEGIEIAPRVYDFGTDTAGWVRIAVSGKAGSEIAIRYSERLMPDGQAVNQDGITQSGAHTDRYILSDKEGEQVWEQMTLMHGFQYVQIEGEFDKIKVTAIVAHSDLPVLSEFWCDNEIIDAIHRACLNSIRCNCRGLLFESPHVEQLNWTGDGCAAAQAISLNYDAYSMFYEWMHHYKDNQTPAGRLTCGVPTNDPGSTVGANGIDWDSAIIHIPYYVYRYSGDRRIVDLVWENMCASLSFFEKQSDNYINEFSVGDWKGEGTVHHERCEGVFAGTPFFYLDAMMMAEMARATGREDKPFTELAKNIKEAYHQAYIKDGRLQSDNETAIALTAYAGLYEKDEEEKEIARLEQMIREQGYSASMGLHGARTVFEMLSRHGYDETAFRTVTNLDAPGYGSIYRYGRDSLSECLNFAAVLDYCDNNPHNVCDVVSLNHYMLSCIEVWFYEALLGIRIRGMEHKEITVEPKFVSGIHEARGICHGIGVHYTDAVVEIDSPYPFIYCYGGESKALPAGSYCFDR